MCGIAGIRVFSGPPVGEARIRAMTDALAHRGPDGEGWATREDGRLLLGHRRLAILDRTPSSDQPMTRSGRYTLVYNGEIYNYRELADELAARGYEFCSDGDTEVLLAAWEEWGEDSLSRLDGMFAFALWDGRERVLWAARDRFGEKPFLYVDEPGRRFLFASEGKALHAAGHPPALDRDALFDWLAWDMTDDPARPERTFLRGVRSLPPAHLLRLGPDGRATLRRWWSLPEAAGEAPPFADACDRFRELLETSVRRRLRSDVPVGTSLSGGLDSTAIACLMARLSPAGDRNAFSARFDDPGLDEGPWMEIATRAAGVRRHETRPGAEELASSLDAIVEAHEAPVSPSAVAQHEVMRLAAERGVTVLLDGQGADETLAGYLHYYRPYLLELARRDPARFRVEAAAYRERHEAAYPIATGARFRLEARVGPLLRRAGALRRRLLPGTVHPGLDPAFVREHRDRAPPFRVHRTLRDALAFSTTVQGLPTLLRLADRNSMAFSREVRLPFLFHELVEHVFTLPPDAFLKDGWTKRILRVALSGILPPEIARREDKLGYRPPEARWLAEPAIVEQVREARALLRGESLITAPPAGREWAVLVAASLLRRYGL